MREPSGHGIRGVSHYGWVFALLVLALFGARDASAQAITRFVRDTGNINFTTTGGSMRTQPNTAGGTLMCNVAATSAQALNGIPAGRTVRNAYLYWGASGTAPDTSVTLNGITVTASRTFERTFNNGTAFEFYGGFADVTTLVTGNATYTFGGLNVSTGNPWCGSQAVVGGWSLIVIYEGPTERLRAINLYDGLDYFFGSAVTQTPDGFRVPPTNIDGRIAVFTLEGDPQNSGANGAFSEALRFNGTTLNDGLVPPASDPTTQQFDGTISTVGSLTSYGIDVDQYDVTALLAPGQTSATTVYSAGDDLVLLMAQIVSATSDPAVDLRVVKSHTGSFVAGQQGVYTITVSNASGMEREDNTVTVTDTLPAGLTFASGTGAGWSCSAIGQAVTCTHAPTLNAGASLPPITLTVNVGDAASSVTNTVTVNSASFDLDTANNTATDVTAIVAPSLATSTKTVSDLNGGEVAPGDTLRYTVTLTESANLPAVAVVLTDDIPLNTTFAGFVSIPAGASSAFSAPPAGDFNRGLITVSGIAMPGNASRTVVFDVTVAAASPGSTIDNTATIDNPFGPDATPSAPQLIVTPSLLPSNGTKQLYLWSNSQRLSRTRPSGTHNAVSIAGNNGSTTFTLNPPLQSALTLGSGSFPVNLLLARTGSSGFGQTTRNVTVTLTNSSLGTIDSDTVSFTSTTMTMRTFTLNTGGVTAPAGSTFALVVSNSSGNNAARTVDVTPYNGGNYSRVDLNSLTVIDVNSVQPFNAAYNGGALQSSFYPGATVYVRASISDPFGSFDISSATVTLLDPANNPVVTNQPMTAVAPTCNQQNSAVCVFEYAYTVPASPAIGNYAIRVTGNEGVEGVTDLGVGAFAVEIPQPSLTIVKSSAVLSDPVNLTTNPKRIPRAVVRYDIVTTNSGPGTVDANTLTITDLVPANTSLYVATTSGDPVVFINGAPVSGLTWNYSSNVSYSNVGVTGPWTYVPVPDADGFDAAVRALRVIPGGTMNAVGGGNPAFTIQFRVRVN
jgi:uncharacterized repeat protein (TIGR01451 family)